MAKRVIVRSRSASPATIEPFLNRAEHEYRWMPPFSDVRPGHAFLLDPDTYWIETNGVKTRPLLEAWESIPTIPNEGELV